MNKKLLSLLFLSIAFISVTGQLIEGFNNGYVPPPGWKNVHTNGGDPWSIWTAGGANTGGGTLPSGQLIVQPHSGSEMAIFDCKYIFAPNSASLISSAVSLSGGNRYVVRFWMYRDNGRLEQDSLSVYINTVASIAGASFLGKIHRNISLSPTEYKGNKWYQYEFVVPANFNSNTNFFIFNAVSSYGNSMFFDDVEVTTAPACIPPVLQAIKSYNYNAGTGTLTWDAPLLGLPQGYEWAMNTSGGEPSTGTYIPGNSVTVTGITADAINYFYVRADCGNGNYSAWANYAFAALTCPSMISPSPGLTNAPHDQVFSWNPVTGSNEYHFFMGDGTGKEINISNVKGTSTVVPDLLPNHTYSWHVVAAISDVASPTCSVSQKFTTGPEPLTPANNPCSGAIVINAVNVAGNPINSTTTGATISLPAEVCWGYQAYADDDVWFQFTTAPGTPSGKLMITTAPTNGIADIVVQVYAAESCLNLGAPVVCSDNLSNNPESIDLSVLAPNTHYFIRVYSFSLHTDIGNFTITATSANSLLSNITLCPSWRSTSISSNLSGISFQWQLNTGNGFNNIVNDANYNNVNSATLQLINIPANSNGYQYKCIVDGVASYISQLNFLNSWIGNVNNAWENPANWSCGELPNANTDVSIASGSIVIQSNVTIRSLKLNPGVNITVENGFTLTVLH